MIERYQTPEMRELWSEASKYRRWWEVEKEAARAMGGTIIPRDAAEAIASSDVAIDVDRIRALENKCKHDVVAFLLFLEEVLGPCSRYVHYGMTSSDLVDTALAMALSQAMGIIVGDMLELERALVEVSDKHKQLECIGRTHGVHAAPTTFGHKMMGFACETRRNVGRMRFALRNISYGKLSGPVGNSKVLTRDVEHAMCRALGLRSEAYATQVVARDRHAEYAMALALAATGMERLAVELRHLSMTEVGEIEVPFEDGQIGSSSMPHKRNPVALENVCGLARYVRSSVAPLLENVVLWHERDISHSSVERILLPDITTAVSFMARRLTGVVRNMRINKNAMARNLAMTADSGAKLLQLVDAGYARSEAHALAVPGEANK